MGYSGKRQRGGGAVKNRWWLSFWLEAKHACEEVGLGARRQGGKGTKESREGTKTAPVKLMPRRASVGFGRACQGAWKTRDQTRIGRVGREVPFRCLQGVSVPPSFGSNPRARTRKKLATRKEVLEKEEMPALEASEALTCALGSDEGRSYPMLSCGDSRQLYRRRVRRKNLSVLLRSKQGSACRYHEYRGKLEKKLRALQRKIAAGQTHQLRVSAADPE